MEQTKSVFVLIDYWDAESWLIEGVFTTEEKAEDYVRAHRNCHCKKAFCGHVKMSLTEAQLESRLQRMASGRARHARVGLTEAQLDPDG